MSKSKVYRGVRDFSVFAESSGEQILVTVKVGRQVLLKNTLSVHDWPETGMYDQRQVAGKIVGVDWRNDNCDTQERIADEAVKAINEVVIC